MKRAIVLSLIFPLVFALTSVMADDKPKKEGNKKEDSEIKPVLPDKTPEIIERPLTPNTGRYIQHGGDIPGVPSEPPKKETNSSELRELRSDRVGALEIHIELIMRALTGQKKPAEAAAPGKMTVESEHMRPADTAELSEKRLEAVERSLGSIASFLAAKSEQPGNTCRWVRECVYIYCCAWGAPPSDPGTVKCMEQCCGAWENRLVCD